MQYSLAWCLSVVVFPVYLQDYLLGWLALSLDTKCHLQAGCKCEGYPEVSGNEYRPAAFHGSSMSWGGDCSIKHPVPCLVAVRQYSPFNGR